MTLVERPQAPVGLPPCCPHDEPTTDPDVQALRDLIASGLDQPRASAIVWGGVPDVPQPGEAGAWVRRTLLGRLPWVRGAAW